MNLLLEHSNIPGSIYEDVLMYGNSGGILNEMVNLNESTDASKGSIKFRGKFQEAEAINKNKRLYPRAILEANMGRLMENIKSGGLCGELDHPVDSIIHFLNASHKITKLWWEDQVLMGEGTILNTPSGKVLRALINDGVRIGISSRGVGSGKVNEDGILVIGESYKLITFDAVADPSTYAAFQDRVSNKHESFVSPQIIANSSAKNESSSIYTGDKAIFKACLSGIFEQQTNIIKARISK